MLKYLKVFAFTLVVVSCSSSYEPSDKVLAYKNEITHMQAQQQLQKAIWGSRAEKGICGSRDFWFDSESNMLVLDGKISLLAHKRGKEVKSVNKGFNGVVVFEKQYYKYEFDLSDVVAINIYTDPLLLPVFPDCNRGESAHELYIIDLYVDKSKNLKFIVKKDQFDYTMASLMFLIPDASIRNK